MGQTTSSEADAMDAPISQIRSGEDLMHSYQQSIPAMCLNYDEQDWLDRIFLLFSSSDDKTVWSEADLSTFLALFFPGHSSFVLEAAIPVLYRWLLHLGSFPYLNESAPRLDLQTLQQAIILLMRRDEYKLHRNYFAELYDDENSPSDVTLEAKLAARNRRIMFQSLSNIQSEQHAVDNVQRSAEEDEDLNLAYDWVNTHNRREHDSWGETAYVYGPPLPPKEDFPSSCSQTLTSSVSRQDLSCLVKLLLITALFDVVDPDACSKDMKVLNHVTDCTIRAFDEASSKKSEVGWEEFNAVIENMIPNIFSGLSRVFGPLIRENPAVLAQLGEPSLSTATSILKRTFPATPPGTLPNLPPALNLPLLCQIFLFLPQEVDAQFLVPVHSGDSFNGNVLSDVISSVSSSSLVLLQADNGIGLGLYLGKDRLKDVEFMEDDEYEAMQNALPIRLQAVFQYEPALKVFCAGPLSQLSESSTPKLLTPSILGLSDSTTFTLQTSRLEVVQLRLTKSTNDGTFLVYNSVGEIALEKGIKVNRLEVVRLEECSDTNPSNFRVNRMFQVRARPEAQS